MALNPAWVKMANLKPGHAPEHVTLPDTPRNDRSTHDPTHALYAIYGDDPRETASVENGTKLVRGIVEQLSKVVRNAMDTPAE